MHNHGTSWGKKITLVLALLAIAGGVGVFVMTRSYNRPATVEAKAWPRLYYSYFTESDLIVMRETEIVARVAAPYVPQYRGAVWTGDGRYVAVLVDDVSEIERADAEQRELVSVEAATGEVRRWKCPRCTSLVSVGGSEILTSVSRAASPTTELDGVLRVDLSSTELPVALPAAAVGGTPPTQATFVGGAGGQALLMGIDGSQRNAFYFYNRDGKYRLSVVTASPRNALRLVSESSAVTSGGTVRVAVGSSTKSSEYECAELGAVEIHSSVGPPLVNTKLSTIAARGDRPGTTSMVGTRDLWWETDGELHAVAHAGRCAGDPRMTVRPTEWRFHDGRWLQVSEESRWQVRPLGRSARLLLLPESSYADQNELVLEASGKRTLIDPDAVAIAAARPSSEVATCSGCEFAVDPGFRERARRSSPGPAAFVGDWYVHGWQVRVGANRLATSRHDRISCVRPFNEDCFADLTYAVAIDAPGRTMRLTLTSVRFAVADEGNGRTVEKPVFDSSSSDFRVGETSIYRWVRAGVLKDLTVPPKSGNPYLCSLQHPPKNSSDCGA
jgi:hypothetical protein